MKKLMIDSCVFFGMIAYNDFVNRNGVENLPAFLEHNQEKLINKEKELRRKIGNEFFEKYSELNFVDQISKYKEYSNNVIDGLRAKIKKAEILLANPDPRIPNSSKEKARNEIRSYQEKIDSITPFGKVEQDIEDYKLLKNSIGSGLIYQDALNKKYILCTNPYSYEEILNHTKPKNDDPKWLYFNPEQVENLSKHITPMISHSKEFGELTDKLAEEYIKYDNTELDDVVSKVAQEYRTSNNLKDDKEMGNDKNSLGKYGDSKIAAFSSIVGIDLVTHNAKDFIFDKGDKKGNRNIENHIKYVNSQNNIETETKFCTTFDFVQQQFDELERVVKDRMREQEKNKKTKEQEVLEREI